MEKQLSSEATGAKARTPGSAAWEAVRARFLQNLDPLPLLAWRTGLVDSLVLEAYTGMLAGLTGFSLFAVGGYGRRELFLYSDIDLLLLFDSEKGARNSKETIGPFLQRLWDAGLRVSQSVRTIAECTELHDKNIELNVSLLDRRFLAGDTALATDLEEKLARFVHSQRYPLVRNLERLTRERHLKYSDTFQHLEPNIKETPGGLRDFQLIHWLGRLKHSTPDRLAAPPSEPELEPARDFLFTLRCLLHDHYGRDGNALTFDLQDEFAPRCGATDPAQWMRTYFRHARTLYQTALRRLDAAQSQHVSLFSQFRDRSSRMSNAEFSVIRGRAFFRTPAQLEQDPQLSLRMFEFVSRHGIRMSIDAEQRLSSQLDSLRGYYSQSHAIWPLLHRILSLPHAPHALRVMHESGFLTVLFPELSDIDCLVIRDFFHRYTVDEHTLLAIQTVHDLRRRPEDSRAFADLYSELEDPAVLLFALLFHDSGKGSPDQGHIDGSLELMGPAMERIQMPVDSRRMAEFLVAAHLALSSTMNSRDLSDHAVIESLAHEIGTVERLRALTLLTYGDISAVNPTAMTPWRASQLFRVYRLTYQELTRELNAERISSPMLTAKVSPDLAGFLEGFPTRYLRTHERAEIDRHFQMLDRQRQRGVAVEVSRLAHSYRLTLLTNDKPYLLASVAGTLSSFGLNIVKAQAFANDRKDCLDTFHFTDPLRNLELNPTEIDRLVSTVERVVLGTADVRHLLRTRAVRPPVRSARIEPTVFFDSDTCESATLVELMAEDRPGLLYDVSRALSGAGCNIEVVLIDTEGFRAVDVFYVTAGGQKLTELQQEHLRDQLLAACRGQVA